jgi:hypothetical protein
MTRKKNSRASTTESLSTRPVNKKGLIFRPYADTRAALLDVGGRLDGVLSETNLLRLAQDLLISVYRDDPNQIYKMFKGIEHGRTIVREGILFRPYVDAQEATAEIVEELKVINATETDLLRLSVDLLLEEIGDTPRKVWMLYNRLHRDRDKADTKVAA